MSQVKRDIYLDVRNEVDALVASCGNVGVKIGDDEVIPETGLLDSAAIIELVGWLEQHFKFVIEEDEITVDILGTINLIVAFVQKRRAG